MVDSSLPALISPRFPLLSESLPPSPLPASVSATTITVPSPLPFVPLTPHVGPQRVLAPTRIASSPDGGAGAGPHSPVTGTARDGLAAGCRDEAAYGKPEADGSGDVGRASEDEVEITGAVIHGVSHAPRTPGPLTLPELRGLPHTPHALRTIGEGRCSVAAAMLAMRKLPDAHTTDAHRRAIDAERLALGARLRTTWSEERWVQEVPLVWRMSRVPAGAHAGPAKARTSYTAFGDLLCDKAMSREFLEPSVFHLVAEAYDVGVFVIQWYPTRGHNATFYWHIRPESKQHIVVWFANGHFEAVRYDRQRLFATDHPFAERLRQLCTSHAAPAHKEDDLDQHIRGERLLARSAAVDPQTIVAPPAADETCAVKQTSTAFCRTTRSATGVVRPACYMDKNITADCAPLPPASHNSNKGRGKRVPPAARSSSSRVRSTATQVSGGKTRRASIQPQTIRTAASHVPEAGASLSASHIAAHGQLYDYISFPNIPQWVSMCTHALQRLPPGKSEQRPRCAEPGCGGHPHAASARADEDRQGPRGPPTPQPSHARPLSHGRRATT